MTVTDTAFRIVAVDDNRRYLESLATLLGSTPGVRLVGTYAAAEPLLAAWERAYQLGDAAPCDIVLMDLGLPAISGVEATRRLKAWFPRLHIIALTVFEDPRTVLEAICAGVDGYVLKETSIGQLTEQLQLVARNGATISPRLAGTVLKLIRVRGEGAAPSDALPKLGLTDRQLDVLRALAEGRSYREIGRSLGVSVDTVRTHIRHTYAALQVRSAAKAVSQAFSRGLL